MEETYRLSDLSTLCKYFSQQLTNDLLNVSNFKGDLVTSQQKKGLNWLPH